MLPVWQEDPHHSVGLGLMLNCAKRLSTEPRVNLYRISSPFLCKTACTYVHDQAETNIWERGSLVMHDCMQTPSLSFFLPYSLSLCVSQLVMCLHLSQRCSMRPYTLAEIKVLVWQDIFLTLLLSHSGCLCVSLSPILTISQCCYWNVCVCWCGLWNWWMTSHGRFIVRILVQLERKLMASWDYGGLRANTCLFHQETWGHFFTPSQIRASPHHQQHSLF